jgi:hypothetical protein
MTTTNRLGGYLSLLPLVNVDKRPRLVVKKKNESSFLSQVIPFALFEDLQETMHLMEYANGVRPYILEWYNDVFLETYNSKATEDSKYNSRDELLAEKLIAVTTKELIDKTFEMQKKKLSTQQILQTYIKPLVNENIIDFVHSEIDKRARIYFPVAPSPKKYNKLFTSDEMNNFSQQPLISVEDSSLFPDKEYIISKIEDILKYSSDSNLFVEIQDHKGKTITIERLVTQYYTNSEDYFEQTNRLNNKTDKAGGSYGHNEQTTISTNQQYESEEDHNQSERKEEVTKEEFAKTTLSNEYIQTCQINNESDESLDSNIKNTLSEQKESRELFTPQEMNNLLLPPIITLEDFYSNPSWPFPEHDLEQSPCRPIIDTGKLETMEKTFYRCKIHPNVWNIDLIGIEHHCKYQEPDILLALKLIKECNEAKFSLFKDGPSIMNLKALEERLNKIESGQINQ